MGTFIIWDLVHVIDVNSSIVKDRTDKQAKSIILMNLKKTTLS